LCLLFLLLYVVHDPLRTSQLALAKILQGDGLQHLADGILGIGNAATRQTYAAFERVQMVNGTTLRDAAFDWCPKDYDQGRRHFAFFSGGGNLHKGLDLVLEAFSQLDQHLWISTRLDADFKKLYRTILTGRPNIHTLGWVQPRSGPFYQMMHTCSFCLLPPPAKASPRRCWSA